MEIFFNQNCKYLRKLYGLKQSEIKGFKASTWGNYETGTSKPGFDELVDITKLFGVTLDQLVFQNLEKTALIPSGGYYGKHQKPHSIPRSDARSYKEKEEKFSIAAEPENDLSSNNEKPLPERITDLEAQVKRLLKALGRSLAINPKW